MADKHNKVYIVWYTYFEPYAVVIITTDERKALSALARLGENNDDYWIGEYEMEKDYGREGEI